MLDDITEKITGQVLPRWDFNENRRGLEMRGGRYQNIFCDQFSYNSV